jgi:glycylpeptide N-tetradecanoyltransferase
MIKDETAIEAAHLEEMHKFWIEQPVVPPFDDSEFDGYIDATIPVTAPPDQPLPLPSGFSWSTIDVSDPTQLRDVYSFLASHYVEDDDHRFRFLLSSELLHWALTPPNAIPEWIFGVRARTGALAGFISGVPVTMRLKDDTQRWASVNFLCVHARLRTKSMAPTLIAELARRVRQSHIYRAIFSGSKLPARPLCSSSYHHRPLNLKRVHESGYYFIEPKRADVARTKFALPSMVHGNCRPFTAEDVPSVVELFRQTSARYTFDVVFDEELVGHMLLPRPGILYSYVIPGTTGPKGFFSFYIMNWKVIDGAMKGSDLKAAYVWFTAVNGVDPVALIADLLNKAVNDAHADVASALGIGGMREALIANKFEAGSKDLLFYSYNYAVPPMDDAHMRFLFV